MIGEKYPVTTSQVMVGKITEKIKDITRGFTKKLLRDIFKNMLEQSRNGCSKESLEE